MKPVRQKFHNEMKLRGLFPRTVESYTAAVSGLALFYNRSPEEITEEEITEEEIKQYLLYLIDTRQLAVSSCNIALSAFKFFFKYVVGDNNLMVEIPYRKRQKRLPVILNHCELGQLFSLTLNPKHRLLMMTAYSSGVRVSELVKLKLEDIDSHNMTIRVNQGKGSKDRLTEIPRAHIFGYSFGGRLAIAMSSLVPNELSAPAGRTF